MNTNAAIVAIIVAVVVLTGVIVYLASDKDKDPDYYEDPYYTVSYSISTEQKTLYRYNQPDITIDPTGRYTYLHTHSNSYGYSSTGGSLGDDGNYVWWDITIEIYSKPNTNYNVDSIFFKYLREHPDDILYDAYMRTITINYTNFNVDHSIGSQLVKTNDKGRFTLTFSIGVHSDQVMSDIDFIAFGAPRSVTFIP